VAALIIVMAVMNGFRAELLDRILGLNGHHGHFADRQPLDDYEEVSARIAKLPGVTMVMPIVEGQALATGNVGAGRAFSCAACAARISSSWIRSPRTSRKAPSRPI
jgi:lipoprotein-releasing system permease protein